MSEFEGLRPRLVRVAYGLLGDLGEAEDVVQEAWIRLGRVGEPIVDVEGWLVVAVSRLALDVLRSARRRREEYVGEWLPEPVVTAVDPADRVTLEESLSMAMMVVLETLSPAERAVFVLHEVFGVPLSEVAVTLGRSPAAVRQLASRARRHVQDGTPRFDIDASAHRRVVGAFAEACSEGDLDALMGLLAPDVVYRSDGGGVVKAAINPVVGADRVARFILGVGRKAPSQTRPVDVNGRPGLLRLVDGATVGVYALTVADGLITRIDLVMNPEKLRSVP
ncbi:RNA polymerase sigma factor SigJ [Actinocorallia longicatena]|uniref:RNA polymerase sigma factor SigJ n=1 Tax=Actinocorallia longicatena TaxID=111803 RepID=UPI0031D4686B